MPFLVTDLRNVYGFYFLCSDTTLQQLSMAASNRLGGSIKTERRTAISTTRTMRSTGSKVSVPASLYNLTSIGTGEATTAALTPLDELVLCHIQTLVIADQDEDAEEALVTAPKTGTSMLSTQDKLPTVRLRISLLHSSSLNSGVRVISPEQVATSPSWDNLGEIYFRGTLRDLDSTYLEASGTLRGSLLVKLSINRQREVSSSVITFSHK